MPGVSSARRRCVCLLSLPLAACAAASPGPRGPLLGPGVDLGFDYSYAYGHADIVLADGHSQTGSADNFWGDLTFIPRRLEARLSPLPWLDAGVQLGWLDGGLDLRAGSPAHDDAFAFNVAAGFQRGRHGLFHDTKHARMTWVRLEAYPFLDLDELNARLVFAAGINIGRFFHELADPRPSSGYDHGLGYDGIALLRDETRLETSIGFFAAPGKRLIGSALFTLNPYLVVDNSDIRTPDEESSPAIRTYRQDWGVVLVARLALHLGR